MIQFLFALLAGIVTIAGPCILPLLPIILGTATVKQHRSRPLFIILGFTLSFTLFAVLFAVVGQRLNLDPSVFRTISAIVIGLFGVVMVVPHVQEKLFAKLQPLLTRLTPTADPTATDRWGGFILGTSLGLIWTPCAGPILGSILTLIVANQNLGQAGALLFAYALGAGIPMLAIAYGGQTAMQRVRVLSRHAETIQRVFGVIIILVALSLLFGLEVRAQNWLLIHTPWLFLNLNFNL
ncbi:MAG: cytochrome c biogenesis CcdA family protein [bacterium]|nr:cytochrome c biogenesis CcdA family protein [bacterium]